MDAVWDCMNIASRIGKLIESSDGWVPKNQQASGVSPSADLQELNTTINSVRSTLVPFVTSSKKSKLISGSEANCFEICIKGIKDSLNDLYQFFKDIEKDFSIHTWKTQRVKIYQMDFLIKQKLDQFAALFNTEASSADSKDTLRKTDKKEKTSTTTSNPVSLIADSEGKEMWIKSFGESTLMVPWNVFFNTLETYTETSYQPDEKGVKEILGFTKTDHVSCYEFSVFLKWFGPFKGSVTRMLEALNGGLLCGFVPAVEANLLLENQREGTYLIRCSKTQPGSFAVTFVDNMKKIKHCLLFSVVPHGLTLKNPPTVYASLKEFADAHTNKLKHPYGNQFTVMKKLPFPYDPKISGGNASESTPDNNNENPTPAPTPGTGEGQCIVCMDAPLQTVFLECGHLACCANCSEKLKLCPICRQTITRIIPIFRVT